MRDRVAVVAFEETDHLGIVGAVEGREGMIALERPEEGAGERPVDVGKRDHHRAAVRPDVKGVGVDAEPSVRAGVVVRGGNREFLVPGGEVVLGEVEAAGPLHRRPDRAEGAVGADHEIRLDPFPTTVGVFEDRGGAVVIREVGVHAPRLELDLDARRRGGGLDQQSIEPAPAHGVDRPLGIPAVRREDLPALHVNHAARHADRLGEHRLLDAGGPKRMQSADADREVDRTSALRVGTTRVETALEQPDPMSGLAEFRGEHRAGESGSGDHDVVGVGHA